MSEQSESGRQEPARPRAELSAFELEAPDSAGVLRALARQAEEAGWVKPSFTAALLEREAHYPTGLPTEVPVAIPHADVEHVLRPGLGVALLNEPVSFGEMGGAGGTVEARLVVLILVREPHEQVGMLSALVGLFQQPGWFEKVRTATTVDELVEIFTRMLDEQGGTAASR